MYDRAYIGATSHRLLTPAMPGDLAQMVLREGTTNEVIVPVRLRDESDGHGWECYPQAVIQSD